jgi:hypothetical protein
MNVFMRRFFSMEFVLLLLVTLMIAGCSRLPWSKSKEKEDLPEGKTVSIENLEESKGENTPPQADKRPQESRADEGKKGTPPEMKTGEGEKGETIALAPTAPPDLTFSPVKNLKGLKRKICVLGFEDRTNLQTEKYGELATQRLLRELERTQKAVLVDKEVVWKALAGEGIEPQGLTEPHAMKKAHQLLGIQAFVTSSISDLQVTSSPPVGGSGIKSSMASARIELRLIDASTGNINGKSASYLRRKEPILHLGCNGPSFRPPVHIEGHRLRSGPGCRWNASLFRFPGVVQHGGQGPGREGLYPCR